MALDHGWLSGSCHVELSASRAWSGSDDPSSALPWRRLSFEALGDAETMRSSLDRAVDHFFRKPPPMNLRGEASCSYPVWLHRLYQKPD